MPNACRTIFCILLCAYVIFYRKVLTGQTYDVRKSFSTVFQGHEDFSVAVTESWNNGEVEGGQRIVEVQWNTMVVEYKCSTCAVRSARN